MLRRPAAVAGRGDAAVGDRGRARGDVFQGLPHHYIEIATDLCKHAREDLEDWNELYDLVDTIRSVRHNKIQAGLRGLDENALKGVKLNNLSAMEVSVIRPFMCNALDSFLEETAGAE